MLQVLNAYCYRSLSLGAAVAAGLAAVTPAAFGQEVDFRDCRTCHMVESPEGQVLERGGRSGPNLYGVAGRLAGSDARFRHYSQSMQDAGQAGVRWTESEFVRYMADPDSFLRDATGNSGAQGEMHVSLRSGAREMFAYLESLAE